MVRNLARGGTTVILTTHYMDEAEALADRLAVIAGGRIVASGTPESIGGREVSEATIRFRLPDGVGLPPAVEALATSGRGMVEMSTRDEVAVLHQLTGWALESGVALHGLTVSRLTLEDVYLRLTGSAGPGGPNTQDGAGGGLAAATPAVVAGPYAGPASEGLRP